jgi:hypothetical protein
MRVRIVAGIASALIGAAALAACGNDPAAPGSLAARANEPFFIRGAIAETGHPWGTLVRGEGSSRYPVTAAFFTIQPATVIERVDGSPASAADLAVGKRITVWITGAIAESLPPQVGARLIVID